jgi:hypothetical protein
MGYVIKYITLGSVDGANAWIPSQRTSGAVQATGMSCAAHVGVRCRR